MNRDPYRNLIAFLIAALLVVLLTECGCSGCAKYYDPEAQVNPHQNVVQLMSPEQFQEAFGLTAQQYEEVMKMKPPCYQVFGAVRFQMDEMLPWMRKNFHSGGDSAEGTS